MNNVPDADSRSAEGTDDEVASPIGNDIAVLSYRDAMAELEEIVEELDDGDVDIDTLSIRFQRAIEIVEELDRRIMRTRKQIDRLTPRLERVGKSQPSSSD